MDPSSIIVADTFDAQQAGQVPDPTKWLEYEQWAKDQGLSPIIDDSRAHSGTNSARVTSNNSGLGSVLVPATGFPPPNNSFYVRVFMNWEKATAPIAGHSAFIIASDTRENGAEVRLGVSGKAGGTGGILELNLMGVGSEVSRYSNGFTTGADPSGFPNEGVQFLADTWYCVEAYFGGAVSEFRVWIDEVEIEEMHVTDFAGSPGEPPRTSWAPTYNFVRIGAHDYDANLGQIWYDDVIVATQRIGCN